MFEQSCYASGNYLQVINCFDFFSAEVVKRPVKHRINLVLPKCHSVHFKLNLASNGFTTKQIGCLGYPSYSHAVVMRVH